MKELDTDEEIRVMRCLGSAAIKKLRVQLSAQVDVGITDYPEGGRKGKKMLGPIRGYSSVATQLVIMVNTKGYSRVVVLFTNPFRSSRTWNTVIFKSLIVSADKLSSLTHWKLEVFRRFRKLKITKNHRLC